MPQGFAIAIDGPVASGKGTLAKALAKRLHGFFMNTGGMYRTVALYCIEHGVLIEDEMAIANVLPEMKIDVTDTGIFLNGNDVTERIKAADTSAGSSKVAVFRAVREAMVRRQQGIGKEVMAQGKIVIAEGRDAGTRIFPKAAIKIFLTADPEVRAKRRQAQYQLKGENRDLSEMLEEVRIRDKRDSTRAIDPLVSNPKANGYWVVDDSGQTPEETADRIIKELVKRGLIDDKN